MQPWVLHDLAAIVRHLGRAQRDRTRLSPTNAWRTRRRSLTLWRAFIRCTTFWKSAGTALQRYGEFLTATEDTEVMTFPEAKRAQRDARRARLERKLDEDLAILRRDLVQTIAVSPMRFAAGKEALALAVEAMLARPNGASGAQSSCARLRCRSARYLDAQRGTENFDSLFRHEVGFVFFQAARSLVDTRGVTTPAETEAWRKTLVDDVERCEKPGGGGAIDRRPRRSAPLAERRGDRACSACQSADARRSARHAAPRRRRSSPDETPAPPGANETGSKKPSTPEAYFGALGVLADVHYALHAMLRRPATTVAAYIASAATGFALHRLDIERMTTRPPSGREAAAC